MKRGTKRRRKGVNETKRMAVGSKAWLFEICTSGPRKRVIFSFGDLRSKIDLC